MSDSVEQLAIAPASVSWQQTIERRNAEFARERTTTVDVYPVGKIKVN